MKQLLGFLFITFLTSAGFSQLVTDNTMTPQQLVNDVLIGGGVTASNIQFTGDANAIGYFDATNANVGIGSGIIMTTGTILDNPPDQGPHGPNDLSGAGVDNGQPGEPLLAAAAGNPSFNAARLEFDFVPQSDTIRFNYVFASEEYMEFVGGGVNDAFGFFISGPNPGGGNYTDENIALIPGTTTTIDINNVNANLNSAYYVDNGDGNSAPQNASDQYIQYDGRTVVLEASAPVTCGETYHIVIAISDIGDGILDSGVFLEEDSFSANAVAVSIVTQTGDTSIVEGCAGADIHFIRPEADTLDTLIVDINIGGTATNGTDYNTITTPITFLPGEDSVTISFNPIADGIPESAESVILTVYTINACGDTIVSTGTLWIMEPYAEVSVNDTVIPCPNNDGVWLVATPIAGVAPYTFQWPDNSTNDSLFVPTNAVGTFDYTITMTDFCGEAATDVGTVTVNNYDAASFLPDPISGQKPLPVNFTNQSSVNGVSYVWDFGNGDGETTATPTDVSTVYQETGEYVVTLVVTSAEGCIDTAVANISVFELPTISAPNVFTPDGDDVNEVFQFFDYQNINTFKCEITNRWGNVMTTFDNVLDTWDGTIDGKPAEEGVYFYTYVGASLTEQEISGHGFFHLVRK